MHNIRSLIITILFAIIGCCAGVYFIYNAYRYSYYLTIFTIVSSIFIGVMFIILSLGLFVA